MEIELSEHSNLNQNNKFENDDIAIYKNENFKLNKSKKISHYFIKNFLFILFILIIFIIYSINVYIFCQKDDSKKVDIVLDNKKLNKIEEYLKTLKPNPLYKGPIFPQDEIITKEWVFKLIDFMKNSINKGTNAEKYIDKVYLLQMLSKAKKILFEQQESLIEINIPNEKYFTVVGDIHGQFYDLLNIFKINGYPNEENPYLFNGDFVDRGVFGLECIITIIAFKILYPKHVFMSRGNHEDIRINSRYGFKNEILDKYDNDMNIIYCFSEFYKFLPLGHILNKEVLVIHGGLFSKDGVTLDELKKIDRFIDIPTSNSVGEDKILMNEILWSDPWKQNGWAPSRRGAGINFGPDIAEKFLNENNLKLLVRSHQVKMEGYEIEPGGKVITLFSAPNYCDMQGNKGAIIKFKGGEMKPNFIKFEASPHPNIPVQKYLSPFL